jgi:hypothetical protein
MDPIPPDLTPEDLLELLPEAHVMQPTEDGGDVGDEGDADEGDDVEVNPLEGMNAVEEDGEQENGEL